MFRTSLLFLLSVSLGLAACATPPPLTPTPDELLDRAAAALPAITSGQFALTREGAPAVLDPQTGATFTELTGLFQSPDKGQATVKIGLMGQSAEVQIFWLPEGNQISNPLSGSFVAAPKAIGELNVAAMLANGTFATALKDSLQNVTLVGTEPLNEATTYHLKGEATGAQLAVVSAGGLTAETTYAVDVWLDTTTHYPLQVHVTETAESGWLFELFALNEPVEIKAP